MKLKCLYFVLFLLLLASNGKAQPSPQEKIIDSLKRTLSEKQHDTVTAAQLDLIAFYYQYVNPDSGVRYAALSFMLAESAGWKRGQILALMDMSNNYSAKSMFSEGIEKGESALTLLETENMPQVKLAVLSNLSLLYKDLGFYGKALEYLFAALTLENQTESKQNLPIILENIGSLYVEQGDYNKADSLFDVAYGIQLERGDTEGLARNLSNKARIEQKRNHPEKAIHLFKQALQISADRNNLHSMQVMYANLGIAYTNLKLYDSAIRYHQEALLLSQKLNSERSIAINSGNLGQAWFSKANDRSVITSFKTRNEWLRMAQDYLVQACDISFRSNFRGPYLEFSDYLTQLYLEQGDFKAAASILGKRLVLMKLVNEEEEKVKMVRLESQRIMEIKEYELAENKKNLEISELKLGLQKRNVLTIVLVFVFLAILGLVLMLYLKKRGDYHKSILHNISLSHSHEIRGPLARIMGLADLLKNDLLEEKDKDYIYKSIEDSAKELDRNISDIIYKSSHNGS
jgi:tetratricopeptide (TPR) repeat protein